MNLLRSGATVFAVAIAGISLPAHAFGLRTHLYIADQILEDLGTDPEQSCTIDLLDREREIPPKVCQSLREHPGAFLAGAIGPDAFPDLIVGQSFVHPGTEDGRQTADWLDHMLSRAEPGSEEMAFAFGNVIHAAGDIFAHSYVNNYAGGVFNLTANRAKDIENRHTKLEKYIDQRLEYDPPLDELKIPTEFVVDTMVRTSYVPTNHSFGIDELVRLFENPAGEIAALLGTKIKSGAPGTHMMVMWGMLALAEREQRLAPCKLVKAVESKTAYLQEYLEAEFDARRYDALQRGIEPPDPIDLPNESTGSTSPQRTAGIDCEIPQSYELRGYPDDEEREPTAAHAALAQAQDNYAAMLVAGEMDDEEFATDRRQEWWKTLPAAQRRRLGDAFDNFLNSVKEEHEQRALMVFTDYWADDVRIAIERYMEASLKTAREMVRSSAPYPQSHLEGEGGATHYARWFDCYKSTFEGEPVASAVAICDRRAALGREMSLAEAARLSGIGDYNRNLYYRILSFGRWIDEQMTSVLFGVGRVVAPSMTELVETLTEPRRIGRDELDRTFQRNGNGQVRFACVSDWIDADLGMLGGWEGDGFRPDGDCAMVNETTYVLRSSPHLSPEKFVALRHALTLGKLALLDRAGVVALAQDAARQALGEDGAQALAGTLMMGDQDTYSVLLDTPRSLDGSYQWNGQSMPYPKEKGYNSPNVDFHKSGFPMAETPEIRIRFDMETKNRPGFPFYRTDDLRRYVFSRLFPEPFEGEILKAKQFDPKHYPFHACSNDPFRAERGGQGSRSVCLTGENWEPDTLEGIRDRASEFLEHLETSVD